MERVIKEITDKLDSVKHIIRFRKHDIKKIVMLK